MEGRWAGAQPALPHLTNNLHEGAPLRRSLAGWGFSSQPPRTSSSRGKDPPRQNQPGRVAQILSSRGRSNTKMTPAHLRKCIRHLPAQPRMTREFGAALEKRGTPDSSFERYNSQREHWVRWLGEYDGPGYYGRRTWRRTAEFVYNHINCPSMLIWLGEAAGVNKELVREAMRAALKAKPAFATQCGVIRRIIPWNAIETKLITRK